MLKSMHLHINDDLKSRFLVDVRHQYPDSTIHTSLSKLAKIRGLSNVTFSGDLPPCYTVPLAKIMQTPASVKDADLPPLMAITHHGDLVDAGKD